jgi:protein-S-isoprenylcysteine O-methyltransferase Ste14
MNAHALDTRIPPPVVALAMLLLMWNLAAWLPGPPAPVWRVPAALVLVAVGAAFDLAGLWAFLRARTTINPMKPQATAHLVTGGVYRLTRNPMYLGLLLFLLAAVIYLWSPWAVLGPLGFVAYINRFQITPEERVMRERFGSAYTAWCARVRRWL